MFLFYLCLHLFIANHFVCSVCVCVYVYIYIYVYICIYMCVYMYIYVCICVCADEYIDLRFRLQCLIGSVEDSTFPDWSGHCSWEV